MTIRHFGRFTAWIPGLLIAALLFAPGCGDDDPVEPVTDPPSLSPTPSALMRNFKTIYTHQLIEDFTALLHPDFQMILLSGTCQDWGWPSDMTFGQDNMTTIHVNMFSGQPGQDSVGNAIYPVAEIVIDLLELQGVWVPITEETQFFNEFEGQWANYEVLIKFWNADLSHNFEVQQQVNFYVIEVTIGDDTGYQLLGIRGLPLYQKVEGESFGWGDILAAYR